MPCHAMPVKAFKAGTRTRDPPLSGSAGAIRRPKLHSAYQVWAREGMGEVGDHFPPAGEPPRRTDLPIDVCSARAKSSVCISL
jgi:hypothetical protein